MPTRDYSSDIVLNEFIIIFIQLRCGESIYATGNKMTSSFLVAFCVKRVHRIVCVAKSSVELFLGIFRLFVKAITDSLR